MFKDGPSWAVELPAFGFSPLTVQGGFSSWDDAGDWLAERENRGSSSASWDRAPVFLPRRADMNVPPVYR